MAWFESNLSYPVCCGIGRMPVAAAAAAAAAALEGLCGEATGRPGEVGDCGCMYEELAALTASAEGDIIGAP